MCAEKTFPTPAPEPPPAWIVDTKKFGSMDSCCLHPILTLTSPCCSKNRDLTAQVMFFQSSDRSRLQIFSTHQTAAHWTFFYFCTILYDYMYCIVLLPYDWLIRELRKWAGVQVFVVTSDCLVTLPISQKKTKKPSIVCLSFILPRLYSIFKLHGFHFYSCPFSVNVCFCSETVFIISSVMFFFFLMDI